MLSVTHDTITRHARQIKAEPAANQDWAKRSLPARGRFKIAFEHPKREARSLSRREQTQASMLFGESVWVVEGFPQPSLRNRPL